MLDFHANSSGGSTTGALVNTILAGGDGQTVAGVPIAPHATLVGWGHTSTVADTIASAQLQSQDQVDPINGENYTFGASSLLNLVVAWTNIPYKTGVRNITAKQNSAAANCMVYYIDHYSDSDTRSKYPSGFGSYVSDQAIVLQTVYSGALTAITWGAQAFAPTTAIPNGIYEIAGVWVSGLTAAQGSAFIRFRHADFGIAAPGFPVQDRFNTAVANSVLEKDQFMSWVGYQFVRLSELLRQPCCPRFGVTNAGTGLRFEMADITADTPNVLLNINKVADLGASGLG